MSLSSIRGCGACEEEIKAEVQSMVQTMDGSKTHISGNLRPRYFVHVICSELGELLCECKCARLINLNYRPHSVCKKKLRYIPIQ